MTRLVEALRSLGLAGEISLAGRWLKLPGERCPVYVVEATGGGYYTWCDDPDARAVQSYLSPTEAIRAGLQRAAYHEEEKEQDTNA